MRLTTILILYCVIAATNSNAQPINRQQVVERHTVMNSRFDSLSSLTVGNGAFAFTVDVTGLQSFPNAYAGGVPLGTQSEWGWHSYVDTANYQFKETLKTYHLNGRDVTYAVQINEPPRQKNAVNWFRQNPHRLQLGNIGLEITLKNGQPAGINDIQNIQQSLNMWTGEINSRFTVEDTPVQVITYGHQQDDAIAVKINTALVATGRIKIRVRLPYAGGDWKDVGVNFDNNELHTSVLTTRGKQAANINHRLDTTAYNLALSWKGKAIINKKQAHYYVLKPVGSNSFEAAFRFSSERVNRVASFNETAINSRQRWQQFWKSGGAVDFTGSTDPRAKEIERRVILSQYLTKVQCAGKYPPQETGLTYNSWYGKPHLEMHWWHGLHFPLWGRKDLLEKSMPWYKAVAGNAFAIAKRQGYEGLRWQKMTDPAGEEAPSSIGAFLIWQQPHFISFAELCYQQGRQQQTLEKYKELVFATADFMASYAHFDNVTKRYILGKGVIAAQERFKADTTFNPTYELVYWHWALSTAQQWRQRLGLPPNKQWAQVLQHLSPLPIQQQKYLFTQSATDSYTNPEFKTDHPSVLGAWGMLPKTNMVDSTTMQNTFDWIWKNWSWNDTWGWDFPMTAMTATRMGMPEKAVEALLMPIQTNTYLNNGHNYQDERLTIYLPGNGGVLTAVALMCAGWEGNKVTNPGFPKDGRWKVKWEGLHKMF